MNEVSYCTVTADGMLINHHDRMSEAIKEAKEIGANLILECEEGVEIDENTPVVWNA